MSTAVVVKENILFRAEQGCVNFAQFRFCLLSLFPSLSSVMVLVIRVCVVPSLRFSSCTLLSGLKIPMPSSALWPFRGILACLILVSAKRTRRRWAKTCLWSSTLLPAFSSTRPSGSPQPAFSSAELHFLAFSTSAGKRYSSTCWLWDPW